MADDEKVEVEVSSSGGKLSLSGGSISRLSNSLADLISPFSQTLGLVGDHVRIYREQSVKRALVKAAEIAANRNEKIKPVNPKNFVPWLENASLENDDDMAELWARLLLSGGESFSSELAIFTDTLRRIGKAEAIILEELCKTNPDEPPESAKFSSHYPDLLDRLNRQFLKIMMETLPRRRKEQKFEEDVEQRLVEIRLRMAKVTDVESDMDADQSFLYVGSGFGANEVPIACLEHERLVVTKTAIIETPYGRTSVNYYEATLLGVRLMMRCYPDRVTDRA